ncbi:MAG: endonuclease domain-containing protein [Ignavibacteriae bacterium]|nr:endonuclease domain-containing protein [Ignavibacteriota bacterium]
MLDRHTLRQRGLITTGHHIPYNPRLKEIARQLRRKMTEAEKKLWYGTLRDFDYTILRQKPLDNFIVDFYCPKAKLVIEVDGDSHDAANAVLYDEERDSILESYGLKVIRFQNEDVMNNFERVRKRILTDLSERIGLRIEA